MDFQRLQNRQINRMKKLWKTTRRGAIARARTLLEAGLEYVQGLEAQTAKRVFLRKPGNGKVHPKKPLKSFVNKPQSDVINLHAQTARHH